MSDSTVQTNGRLTKKEVSKAIREKLAGVFSDLKEVLGEKKFDTRIKKASRLFSREIVKMDKKKNGKQKKVKARKADAVADPVMDK
jgi:hypothetical protein